jgi:hypothetical protein
MGEPVTKALDKRALWRELERDMRAGRRARLAEVGSELVAAKARRRLTVAEAKTFCRDAKNTARARAAELEREAKALRRGASGECVSKVATASLAAMDVRAAKRRRTEVEEAVRDERAADRMARARTRPPKTSAAERRGESDDEVRANIPPELATLFERVRRQIRGSSRKSRTEEFLEYAEAHPGEAVEAIEDATDTLIAELEAQAAMMTEPEHGAEPNPQDVGLVLLGHLTSIEWIDSKGRRGRERWPLERAPLLAYDGRGRLHIVTGAASRGEASGSAARASYASTHWGNTGRGALLAGETLRGPFTARDLLGTSTSITYTTTKGGSRVTDYEHEWGEGARGAWRPPAVMRVIGRYALSGGTYRVTSRGIVG